MKDLSRTGRFFLFAAVMLALFLGALDALVVGAAMPTIVADVGGLHLYSWAFSAYLLTRAVSLPIFGKLCDLYSSRALYIVAISVFIVSSVLAGVVSSMGTLIAFRAFQGIGAGGTFALAYIVVSDHSAPRERGKMMGLISFVWGLASILGPALGGFLITWLSWRWIFYINLPLGALALLGILLFLRDTRAKKPEAPIDYLGTALLSTSVIALLVACMMGGRSYPWLSLEMAGLALLTLGSGMAFLWTEGRAREPLLDLRFFRSRGFSTANASAFFSSVAIFSLAAYTPLYIQGALGKTPAELGITMVSLSLAWSVGAFVCGRLVSRRREKPLSIVGSLMLASASVWMLLFTASTSLVECSAALALAGAGMGLVSISTLLVVQNSLDESNLGVSTSAQQFSRTLGGTIGIGICGSLVSLQLGRAMSELSRSPLSHEIPHDLGVRLSQNIESLLDPHFQQTLSTDVLGALQGAVGRGVEMVFACTLGASILSLVFCLLLPSWRPAPMDIPLPPAQAENPAGKGEAHDGCASEKAF
ncbi:MAG: MFS transporter [Syntrophobacteraceae bacterium]|nr:MFS transporter [Syntrophobacteraceae bacterium]